MAEEHGQAHDDVCAGASGALCVCSCRGTLHGIKHRHGRNSRVMRLAEVKVTAINGPGGQHHDITAAGATTDPPATAAGRRRDPVVVVSAVEADTPLGRKVAAAQAAGAPSLVDDGPTVTQTTGPTGALPHDLSGMDDETLIHLLGALPEQGRDDEAMRVLAELERRDAEEAKPPPLPHDLSGMSDDELTDAISTHGADAEAVQRVWDELERREQVAAAAERAVTEAPEQPAAVPNADGAWQSLKDPGYLYRTLGLHDMAGDPAPEDVRQRAAKAERLTLGLPLDATDGEVYAASLADPRKPDDRAQMNFAWYRQIATADGVLKGESKWGPLDSATVRAEQQQAAAEAAKKAAAAAAEQARQQRLADAIAAGPPGPARLRNPAGEWGALGVRLDSYKHDFKEGRQAADWYRLAQTRTLGLPDDADDKDITAAEKAYPGSPGERAATYMAWYRLISTNSTDDVPGFAKAKPDDENVPTPRKALAPANVLKSWDKWQAIKTQAFADNKTGDPSTLRRYKLAMARAFGIPDDAQEHEITTAYNHDKRTQAQMGNAFLAEFRALGEAAGIDRNDELRYGPPDRGGRKPVTQWRELTTAEDAELERLLARGYDYLDAYAAVRNLDPETLRAEQAAGALGRKAGETVTKAARRQYDEWVHVQYVAAETATRGNVLSPAGKAAGVDPVELFSGPTATARKYASEELLRWWQDNKRLTFTEFKAQTIGSARDKAAAARTRVQGNGKDFG